MRKILFIFITFIMSLFACQVFAQSNEINFTNGSVMNAPSSNSQFTHSSSINDGITVSAQNLDYILDSGHLAYMEAPSNPNIVFYNETPQTTSTTPLNVTNATIGVTANVGIPSAYIRQVGYKISSTPPTDENGPFNIIYTSTTAESQKLQTVTVSHDNVVFNSSINYIQWYAQYAQVSGTDPGTSTGNTATYIIYIATDLASSVTILQPKAVASAKPQITANVRSKVGFSPTDTLKVEIAQGPSYLSVFYSTTVSPSDSGIFNNEGVLNYTYDGSPLSSGSSYKMTITYTGSDLVPVSSSETFKVNSEAISDLLPFPSPYNPKKGKMRIRFVLDEDSNITINIYDRAGKFVSKVVDSQRYSAGVNYADWYGKSYSNDGLANGVYICEIIAKGSKENRRYTSFAILRK